MDNPERPERGRRTQPARPRLTDENAVAVKAFAEQHQIPFHAAANQLIRLGVLTAAQNRTHP